MNYSMKVLKLFRLTKLVLILSEIQNHVCSNVTFINKEPTKLTTSFDLSGVINGDRMGAVPLGMSLGAGELDVEGICTRPGMACQNCTVSVTCVPLPVGWLKVPLEECEGGHTCNAHLGRCSREAVPECDASAQEFRHICEQVGIFPDAFDCRKFHLCSPPEGMPDGRPADHRAALCPRHYAYNPRTAQCSIRLQNGQCHEKPIPECKTVGQNGALSLSNNHYYVCLLKNQVLYPQVFICPHGWYFLEGFCRPVLEVKDDQNTYTNMQSNTEKETAIDEDKDLKTEENVVQETQNVMKEIHNIVKETQESTTEKAPDYHVDSFFSTEKVATYATDSFLADRFDLTNYETTDDQPSQQDEFITSFENENDFW